MIIVSDKKKCTACGACASICPKNAISLFLDSEGFRYPEIKMPLCVDCGLCEQVCHMLKTPPSNQTFKGDVFAACLKNREAMLEVSSGGAAWALTQEIICKKGVVYGAIQTGLFDTRHVRVDDLNKAKALRGSKYQESDMGTVYRQVKKDIDSGIKVLFTGTGCQIGGLYSFLGKKPTCLITCDMVCHSIPSLLIFKDFINTIENVNQEKAIHIDYRDKSIGWKYNQIAIYFKDGKVDRQHSSFQPYHSSYLAGLISRPCCEGCRYQKLSRVSDITLADFWNYKGKLYTKYERYGISLVICSTKAGRELFDSVSSLMNIEQVSVEDAISSSRHLSKPAPFHPCRRLFFLMSRSMGFIVSFKIYELSRKFLKLLHKILKVPQKSIYMVINIYKLFRKTQS